VAVATAGSYVNHLRQSTEGSQSTLQNYKIFSNSEIKASALTCF